MFSVQSSAFSVQLPVDEGVSIDRKRPEGEIWNFKGEIKMGRNETFSHSPIAASKKCKPFDGSTSP